MKDCQAALLHKLKYLMLQYLLSEGISGLSTCLKVYQYQVSTKLRSSQILFNTGKDVQKQPETGKKT